MNKEMKEMMEMMKELMQMQMQMQTQMQAQMMETQKKGTRKSAPAQKELVEYEKADGTVKMVSKEQADAWNKFKANGRTYASKEEFQAKMKQMQKEFVWTQEAIDFVIAHPVCTQKEFSAAGFKGCSRTMLREKKHELRAAKLM